HPVDQVERTPRPDRGPLSHRKTSRDLWLSDFVITSAVTHSPQSLPTYFTRRSLWVTTGQSIPKTAADEALVVRLAA
ncbi:MAG: hypothetical protein ACRDTA_19335, partial [Pseudonocardiaceae bacterium]